MRGGTLLAQARASSLTGTALTVPLPTNATSLSGPLPGLSAGAVEVQVYNQIGPASYALVGSTPLTVNDTRSCTLCITGITPSSIDLASPPASFSVAGQGLASAGSGLPVVNFMRGGTLLAQARASSLTGTALTVPFPTNATSLSGPLPGLSTGAVDVQVYNQTGPASYALVGSTPLTVNDTRAQVALFNDLLICAPGCQNFTAQLTASEGYTWFAVSGSLSPYQPVSSSTLSNFQGEAVGVPGATFSFPGTFNIVANTRYVLFLTFNGTSLELQLINQGPLSTAAPQTLGAPDAELAGQPGGAPTIRFAPARVTPQRR
jgi:hypothetical protein